MTLSTPPQGRNDLELLGEAKSNPIEVGSSGSDSESDVPEKSAQSHGFTGHPTTSHNPTLTSSASRVDLRHTSHLSKVDKSSKVSSVSSERSFPGNTGLFQTRYPACKDCRKTKVGLFISCRTYPRLTELQRWCIHDGIGNEDSVEVRQTAIPRLKGQRSVIQATTQQPVSRKVSSDGDDRSENKTTPTAPSMPVPIMQRSFSTASVYSISSDDSDLPSSASQKRSLATREHAKSQPDSCEESDPPINHSQKRRLAKQYPASLKGHASSSEDSDPPINPPQKRRLAGKKTPTSLKGRPSSSDTSPSINPSQKRRLTRHHPAKSKGQPSSSEESDPPVNPSQKRGLASYHPAKSKIGSGSSEDYDPSSTSARGRPLTTSQYARLNVANTPDPSTKRSNPGKSQWFGGVGVDGSISGAHLVSFGKSTRESFTPSSPGRHLDDTKLRPLLQASGMEGSQSSRTGLEVGKSELGERATNTSVNPIRESISPENSTVHNERQYSAPIIAPTGKPIDPIQVVKPAGSVSSHTADDEVSAEVIEQELRSPKARKSEEEEAQQNPSLGNSPTESTRERPKFGIKDIVPEVVASTGHSFTIDDVVSSKMLREPIPPLWSSELKQFHDAMRMAFAPVIVGPDWILKAPVKKRQFTLADITGTGPQESLFSIEYAFEQYQARRNDQEQPNLDQTTDQAQGAEDAIDRKHTVVSEGGDFMVLGSNDSNGERPIHGSQQIIESTADKAAGPDWMEMVGDAENYLAGERNVASTKGVKDELLESSGEAPVA